MDDLKCFTNSTSQTYLKMKRKKTNVLSFTLKCVNTFKHQFHCSIWCTCENIENIIVFKIPHKVSQRFQMDFGSLFFLHQYIRIHTPFPFHMMYIFHRVRMIRRSIRNECIVSLKHYIAIFLNALCLARLTCAFKCGAPKLM